MLAIISQAPIRLLFIVLFFRTFPIKVTALPTVKSNSDVERSVLFNKRMGMDEKPAAIEMYDDRRMMPVVEEKLNPEPTVHSTLSMMKMEVVKKEKGPIEQLSSSENANSQAKAYRRQIAALAEPSSLPSSQYIPSSDGNHRLVKRRRHGLCIGRACEKLKFH
ncbi:secreted protein [Melampsora americana]|nr:secreted protein [Melampsora americana]